jgi:hypothetical protein
VIGYIHSMQVLGREAMAAALVVAAGLGVAAVGACIGFFAVARSAGWRRRQADRRYVRAGIRDLELYLSREQRARRPR